MTGPLPRLLLAVVAVTEADAAAQPQQQEQPIKEVAKALRDKASAGIERLLFQPGPYTAPVAGMHQFAEIWVRDVSHASIGLLARPSWEVGGRDVPSLEIVRDTALAFLEKIEPEQTLAPRVLDSMESSTLVDKETKLKAKVVEGSVRLSADYRFGRDLTCRPDFPGYPLTAYYQGESGSIATIDSNYWLLHAFARYAAAADAGELANTLSKISSGNFTVASKLRLTLGYLMMDSLWTTYKGRVFLTQGPYQEWKDSIKQVGASSFTNLQFMATIEALLAVPALSMALEGTPLQAARFDGHAVYSHGLRDMVLKEVLPAWRRDVLSTFKLPNGLLQESSSVPSMSHIDGHLEWLRAARGTELDGEVRFEDVVASFVTFDGNGAVINLPGTPTGLEWPSSEVAIEKRLIGLANYHGSLAWSWLVGSFLHEAHVRGNVTLRDGILRWLLQAQHSISTSGFSDYISEVYQEGRIVASVLYTSETPFMWGSSYVYWATSAIVESLEREGSRAGLRVQRSSAAAVRTNSEPRFGKDFTV